MKTEQPKLVDKVKKSEQLISMVMGIIVVLAIGGLAYRYFQSGQIDSGQQNSQQQEQQQKDELKSVSDGANEETLPLTHEVNKGESLWDIAEVYYGSGYNWVDIANENNLDNPGILAVGQELTIPDVESKQATIAQLPESGVKDKEITSETYVVQEGDSLSKIAIRAYGDWHLWPRIWNENRDQINNPNVIEPGMNLDIPRD